MDANVENSFVKNYCSLHVNSVFSTYEGYEASRTLHEDERAILALMQFLLYLSQHASAIT